MRKSKWCKDFVINPNKPRARGYYMRETDIEISVRNKNLKEEQRINFAALQTKCKRVSGKDKLKELFLSRPNQWIILPEILNLRVAQYNSRILDLRAEGMNIINDWQMVDGVKHSAYMLVEENQTASLF